MLPDVGRATEVRVILTVTGMGDAVELTIVTGGVVEVVVIVTSDIMRTKYMRMPYKEKHALYKFLWLKIGTPLDRMGR